MDFCQCSPLMAQATQSSAVGLTMPQHNHSSLTHVLLLWITTLSVVQLGFIVFFFTAGRYPSEPEIPLGGGKMLTFKATEGYSEYLSSSRKTNLQLIATFLSPTVNRKIKWVTKSPDEHLISGAEGGKILKIKKDGYYFLTLQITLSSFNPNRFQCRVSLKAKDKDLLKGWINNSTCSTGSLSKVEELSAGSTLEVTVCKTGPSETINEDDSHLDIIYISKPWK
ncbi:hypothetical protein ABVT39_009816 [Epinephelus coioides]